MNYLSEWLRLERLRRQARAWVRANDERVPARCMFHLNRYTRHYRRESIYTLKNHLVRILYQRGFCVRATAERQDLPCWTCDGTGWFDEGQGVLCDRCDGTGVYRSHALYRFVFDAHGTRYVWHQPARLVDWPLDYAYDHNAPAGRYEPAETGAFEHLGTDIYELYGLAVYEFLRGAGVPARDLPRFNRLRDAARMEFDWWLRRHQRLYGLHRRARAWLRQVEKALKRQELAEEIPF